MTKSYQGGKGPMGVSEQIINRMPKHKVYVETHLGGGRVLVNYPISKEDWASCFIMP